MRLKFHASEVVFHGLGCDPFTKHYEMQYLKRHSRIDPFNPCNYKDFTMIRFPNSTFGNGLATARVRIGVTTTVWPRGVSHG